MLKVCRNGESYHVTEVTDLEEIQSVIDGTLDPDETAIYLQDKNGELVFSELTSETVDAILNQMAEDGLLSILDDAYENRELNAVDGVSVLGNHNGVMDDDLYTLLIKSDGYVEKVDTGDLTPDEAEDVVTQFKNEMESNYHELSKDNKLEIIRSAGADLIDTIVEMQEQARLAVATLDEVLDPTDHKARNAMGRLLQAVGADFTPSTDPVDASGNIPDASVDFGFQQLQIDGVTEAVMWAAASVLEDSNG